MRQLSWAVRGEFVRLTRTRLPWWTLISALACGGIIWVMGLVGPENANPPMPGLDTAEGVTGVLSMLGFTLFVPALIGTAAISGEYRHRTVATTFLAIPRRGRVLVAKLVAYAVLGLAYGLVMAFIAAAGVYAGAAVHGTSPGLGIDVVVGSVTRYGLAAAIYMLLGVGIGAIARNQIVAIGITLGYFYLLETLIMLLPGANLIYPFLPGGATAALTGSAELLEMIAAQAGQAGPAIQTPLIGAIVLLGYALVSSALAATASLRRDIT